MFGDSDDGLGGLYGQQQQTQSAYGRMINKTQGPSPDTNGQAGLSSGYNPFSTQQQGNVPQAWALVDTSAPWEIRHFHWRGAGHNADNLGPYVGTVHLHAGALVFHLFEDS